MKTRVLLAACLPLVGTIGMANAADDPMIKLANQSGCMTCHHIDAGAKGPNGLAPIGPAWRDVAAKYKGQKDTVAQLTATVMKGSNPYDSHWKGKASGLAMPPNAVAINEPDAKKLVSWILALKPASIPFNRP